MSMLRKLARRSAEPSAKPSVPVRRQVVVLAAPERAAAVAEHAVAVGFEPCLCSTSAQAVEALKADGGSSAAGLVCALGISQETSCWPVLEELRRGGHKQTFPIVLSLTAARNVRRRLECFAAGAKMVTSSIPAVAEALRRVAAALSSQGPYACPHCGLGGLSEEALRDHLPLYHAAQPNVKGVCPICEKMCDRLPLVVHLQQRHGPVQDREPPPAPYPAFAWSVCRRETDGKFLLVNEPAGISGGKPGYWLPAGRLDMGESLQEAARRECIEEAGIDAEVVGLLTFMVDNMTAPQVMRVALLTAPREGADLEPKSIPDFESCGALWVQAEDLEELGAADYRSPDPPRFYPQIASGEMKAYSVDTDEFRALEALLRRLTAGDESAWDQLPQVWRALVAAYPASAFSCP